MDILLELGWLEMKLMFSPKHRSWLTRAIFGSWGGGIIAFNLNVGANAKLVSAEQLLEYQSKHKSLLLKYFVSHQVTKRENSNTN